MVKLINSKRVLFLKGKQKEFIDKILSKISVEEASRLCRLSERTIRDWRREKFLPDFGALQKICKKVNIVLPFRIELKDRYWYIKKGSFIRGKTTWERYGRVGNDPEYRKKKWYEWWNREGQYKKHPLINVTKPIKIPKFSKELAEFVGIILGDGSITRYQVVITLHSEDDKEYSQFVINLIKKLFSVPIGVYYDKNFKAVDITVSRRELVRFCVEKLGLKEGNKVRQQVDIPDWIKENRQFAIACARGLVDTDGSIFTHRYQVNGKFYEYIKLSFTNHSYPLIQSLFKILENNGLNPRISRGGDVRLDSVKDMTRYFKIFNSSNPKNLKRRSK